MASYTLAMAERTVGGVGREVMKESPGGGARAWIPAARPPRRRPAGGGAKAGVFAVDLQPLDLDGPAARAHEIAAIDPIPEHGVSLLGQVDPDLVGASRLETDPAEGRAPESLDDVDMGHSVLGLLTWWCRLAGPAPPRPSS